MEAGYFLSSLFLKNARLFWFKNHLKFSGVSLSCFALSSSFSISLTQIFLGLSLFIFLIDLIIFSQVILQKKIYGQQSNAKFNKREKAFLDHFKSYQIELLFYVFVAWIALRLLHVFLSTNPAKELYDLREIWLFLIVPLVLYRIPDRKWLIIFMASLIVGVAFTGIYNALLYIVLDISFESYRAGGFYDTLHPLTYTGITGITFFLGLGAAFHFWNAQDKKISILFFLGSSLVFLGFILSQSKGGFLAIPPVILIFLAFAFKKRFIFILPLLLIFSGWGLQNAPWVYKKFEMARNETFDNIKIGHHCGTVIDRIHYYQTGMAIWRDHFIIGVGNADYSQAYQKYRPKDACGVAALPGIHLHNDFLNTVALFGSIGLSIFLLFYFLPLADFLRRYYQTNLKNSYLYIMLGSASSILMMIFLGLTQCHFTDEEVQMVFWTSIGIFYKSKLLDEMS